MDGDIGESIKFLVLGMVVVFLFLALLVQVMKIQAKVIAKYFPEKEAVATSSKANAVATDDASKTAAIIAAITEFKKNKS
jgi:oxaloacetate decarboxylase gamma subunit